MLGVGLAIAMVLKSLDKGRYSNHQQFETIQKLHAGYSNLYMSSLSGSDNLRSIADCPTQLLWFEHFSRVV
jgi:hypothetical protein